MRTGLGTRPMVGFVVFLRSACSRRRTWYALAWALVLVVGAVSLYAAWHSFDNAYTHVERNDGNGGHATIDFGGQYLMGRLLVEGHGRELYNRNQQRLTLIGAYPRRDHGPKVERSDVENLMYWVMGTDDPDAPKVFGSFVAPLSAQDPLGAVALLAAEHDVATRERPETMASFLTPLAARDPLGAVAFLRAGHAETAAERLKHASDRRVGGPLYPPINAFYVAPLALLPAHEAYRVQQVANLVLAFVAGLGFSVLSRGRIWWPVAALVVMLFPGFMGSLNLGQNATLTLAILVWGWVVMARSRLGWGGLIWSLLAFKPVWAMVFFLVLVLTRRWRDALTMLAAGVVLGLGTLPFVGVQSWFDWLKVGHEAAELYNIDQNWIFLSRDVLSIPRRYLLAFEGPVREPDRYANPEGLSCWWYWLCGGDRIPGWLVPTLAGWGLLTLFLEMTVRLAALRKEQARAATGPAAAFVLLGAWLCCYHFMYYDVLLAALPVLLLFTEPGDYFTPRYVRNVPLGRLAAGAATRWQCPDDHETGRWGVAVLALLLPVVLEVAAVVALVLAVCYLKWPWQCLLLLAPVPLALALFLWAAGVFTVRVIRPLVPRPQYRSVVALNRVFPTLAVVLLLTQPLCPVLRLGSYFGPPWDTFVLMGIWLWAGWRWLRLKAPAGEVQEPPPGRSTAIRLAPSGKLVQLGADVGGPHEGFTDEDGADAGRL